MTERERMIAGLPYRPWVGGLAEDRLACKEVIHRFNHMEPSRRSEAMELLKGLFARAGEHFTVEAPFHCDYGYNISVGDYFFANYNLVILDIAPVTIGSHVLMGPNVALYTAGHPIHPESRNTGYEYGAPITVGANAWIGGNTVLLPGATIGEGAVIGAGSVVSGDIPARTIAVGNPCRVVRQITEEDRRYYRQDREFDVPLD